MRMLIFIFTCFFLVIPCQANQADFNNNGKVNSVDFSIFAQAWRARDGELNWNPACDISDPNDDVINENDLLVLGDNWLWSQILLEIYSDGWGTLLDTITMNEEGKITFLIEEENPYSDPPQYYAYASREGYYTELYNFSGISTFWGIRCELTVDLDPTIAGKFNGVIFLTQPFFSDGYLANTDVNVVDIDTLEVVTQFRTDEQGRFAIELQPCNYYFEFYEFEGSGGYHLEPVEIQQQYQEFSFRCNHIMLKPNIYLYPQETTELDIQVVFPHGGQITTAIPDYNDGWHITVEPSGIIDGQFEYLFYESLQPDYGQYAAGWVVMQEELEDFFRNNMAQTGFNEKEIDDFIEYWVPRLTEYPCYAIYPQYNDKLNNMVKLEFSTQPANLIRLIYSVRGLQDDNISIQPPAIPPFVREGFTVVEWGVILK